MLLSSVLKTFMSYAVVHGNAVQRCIEQRLARTVDLPPDSSIASECLSQLAGGRGGSRLQGTRALAGAAGSAPPGANRSLASRGHAVPVLVILPL